MAKQSMESKLFAVLSALGTVALHVGIIALIVGLSSMGDAGAERPVLAMTTIEASLAYKSAGKASKQPQKPQRSSKPPPPVQPEGVSRDETAQAKPDPEKPEPEEDYDELVRRYINERQSQEEEETEGESQQGGAEGDPSPGEFNGSERGFAEVSKGDPYMQELAADAINGWEVPTLEKGAGDAVGCVRMSKDGRVVDTMMEKTGNTNIDRSVELALKNVQERREKDAKPVPAHLTEITTQWTCFNFRVNAK